MIKQFPLVTIIVGLCALVIILVTIDLVTAKSEYHSGTVIDKHYTARSNRTGTGVGVTSGGGAAVIITNSTEPEKFSLMVKLSNGNYVTATGNAAIYYETEIGDEIEVRIVRGRLSGGTWQITTHH